MCVTFIHYTRVSSGWLAAAQAPWSRNHPKRRAPPPGDRSPTNGGCGRISRKGPSRGSVLNSDQSVAAPGAQRAVKRNQDYGCLKGKRNSWIECFRRHNRICAPRRPGLKVTRSRMQFREQAEMDSLCSRALALPPGPRGANPS